MSAFLKAFDSEAAAREAERRSTALRRQAVRSPLAEVTGATVRFQRIEGLSGLPLVQGPPVRWLAPLAALHACRLDGIALFDPLRRIRPRLELLGHPGLRRALHGLAAPAPRGSALLHGDFHLGQVICDEQGVAWLIDLDDLAIGPAEADLGNLIANLATQAALPGPFAARLAHWRRSILGAWSRLGQRPRAPLVDHFTALALIRRHLKLREAGQPDFEAEIAAWVTRAACRTSPSGSAAYRD